MSANMTASNTRSGSQPANISCSYLNTREYEDSSMVRRFGPIAEAMRLSSEEELGFDSADVSSRSLSLLTGQLRAFTETALGKNARNIPASVRHLTKFPHKLFSDYRPDGGLYVMLSACLNFKCLHGLRRLEFQNPDKQPLLYDMLSRIDKALRKSNMLPNVRVFFTRQVPSSLLASLRAIVQKRGTIVSSASDATHVIYPDPEGTTARETSDVDYCRPLNISETHALVHWWYYPDSYDSWIPKSEVDGVVEPPEDHHDPWHVQLRWLQDTDHYNEWMNEADYEVPFETRVKITSTPRPEVVASSRSVHAPSSGTSKHDPERSSKKRRRSNQTGGSTRDSERPGNEGDLMDLGGSSPEHDNGSARRHNRGAVESSNKERRHRESSRKEADSHHSRKRARTNEERKKNPKKETSGSIKVRLPLKPPQERTKIRSSEKEKTRDIDSKDSLKFDIKMKEGRVKKDSGGDIAVTSGLKVRVKLGGKVSDPRHIPEVPLAKEDKDTVDSKKEAVSHIDTTNSKLQPKSPSKLQVKSPSKSYFKPPSKDERSKITESETKEAGDSEQNTGDANHKTGKKEGAPNDPPNEGAPPEMKRPFSRRKRSRKERTFQNRAPGVTPVDDVIPVPEGDVPRIRNISNEGTEVVSMDVDSVVGNGQPQTLEDQVTTNVDKETEQKAIVEPDTEATNDEKQGMDIELFEKSGRVVAVSEKMLSGPEANAPISEADLVGSVPTTVVRMPAHSRWFRTDAIHDIEKRSLPEFFDKRSQSKTPLVYKKYRDFMIDVWRQTPEKYLNATAARRHLAGDVCAILRVHAFLERWGLINYGTEPDSKPSLSSSLKPRSSRPKPIILDGPISSHGNGVPRLLFFDEPQTAKRDNTPVSLQKAVQSGKEKALKDKRSLLSKRELYATAAATKYECDACGADCSRMRYHCVGTIDMELCPTCFANGMFPDILSARDFEQLTTVLSSEAYDGSVWSEAEVLLLLEGLEKFGDDWNQVADHVGSKTNEQCVMQFLRMPIEDSFLGDQLGKWAPCADDSEDVEVQQESAGNSEKKFSGPCLPFADASNPVMAQVAFLASCVSPEVAAAAAQAALTQLLKEDGKQIVDEEENKTAQAKALLGKAESVRTGPSVENGVQSGSDVPDKGSKLSSMPESKLDSVAIEAAASVGFAAAVCRSRQMADAERREIERDFAVAVETKMRVVDLKIREFERLEQHMRRERDRMEKQRHSLFAARIEAAMRAGEGFTGQASMGGMASGNMPHTNARATPGVATPFGISNPVDGSVAAQTMEMGKMAVGNGSVPAMSGIIAQAPAPSPMTIIGPAIPSGRPAPVAGVPVTNRDIVLAAQNAIPQQISSSLANAQPNSRTMADVAQASLNASATRPGANIRTPLGNGMQTTVLTTPSGPNGLTPIKGPTSGPVDTHMQKQ